MRPTAVILAAGKGTRMGCLAEGRAKAMINFKGRPMITHVLHALEGVVDDAVIVVGHRQEDVRELGKEYHGIRLHYAVQPEPIGTTDATLCAQSLINTRSYMLMFCDNIFPPVNVQQCASCIDSCVFGWLKDPTNYGLITMGNGGSILDIWEKAPRTYWPQFEDHGEYPCFMGLVHLHMNSFATLREALQKATVEGKQSAVPDAIGDYAGKRILHGWPLAEPVQSLGTLKEVADAYGRITLSRVFNRSYALHSNLEDDDMYDECGWDGHEWSTRMPVPPYNRQLEGEEIDALMKYFNLPEVCRPIASTLPPWVLDNPYAIRDYVKDAQLVNDMQPDAVKGGR